MIGLQAAIFLAIGLTFAAAIEPPDCENCKYQNGIGFLPIPDRCDAYLMCFKSPYQQDYYRKAIMCCPIGSSWNPEHLTCKINPKCTSDRSMCPNETTTSDLPCPLKPVKDDKRKYSYVATHEVMSCPYRSYFDPKLCTCRFGGPYKKPCCKLLHFDFNDTYDSRSCYNFAAGEPYGRPPLTGGVLCLNGENQFFAIPYLRNWFAWNEIGKTFTLCFWLKAKADQTAGVLSTNCRDPIGNSLIELYLKNGQLYANLGGKITPTDKIPTYDTWAFICVTFDRGSFILFYDGVVIINQRAAPGTPLLPFNSQQDATLGFVNGLDLLHGYFDDFCFWTKKFDKPKIVSLLNERPSNNMP